MALLCDLKEATQPLLLLIFLCEMKITILQKTRETVSLVECCVN